MLTTPYFQLSVLNVCDVIENNEDTLICKIKKVDGIKQEQASFPFEEDIEITTPAYPEGAVFSVPTWYISNPQEIENTSYELEIYSTKTTKFPIYSLNLKASELYHISDTKEEIYHHGDYVLYGESNVHSNGISYTLTAKVAQPQRQAV